MGSGCVHRKAMPLLLHEAGEPGASLPLQVSKQDVSQLERHHQACQEVGHCMRSAGQDLRA